MKKKVLLLLANGFEILEASAFIDVMGWNLAEGDGSTQLLSCGLHKEIQSSFNHRFIADFTTAEIDVNDFDALAIPGGFEDYGFYVDAYDERFLAIIQQFHVQHKPIASICVGALPLAKSGILKERKATTYNGNPKRIHALKEFGAYFVETPIVVDGNIITSWNPSTALDVAFLLLERLTSEQNTVKVRALMGFGPKPNHHIL